MGVPKTGQTDCWNAAGSPIACAGTGQDGEYQTGSAVTPRFTDNGDGTVTDNLSGLIWLQDANCFGLRNWTTALSDAAGLAAGACGLTDGSAAGDWRVPNVRELQSLIDFGELSPSVPAGHPFSNVQPDNYWTSTTYENGTNGAWRVYFLYGLISTVPKTDGLYVWPVRSGQ